MNAKQLKLVNDNGRWFKRATARISTVDISVFDPTGVAGYQYETVLFLADGDEEVLARYTCQFAAVEGHYLWVKKYACNTRRSTTGLQKALRSFPPKRDNTTGSLGCH